MIFRSVELNLADRFLYTCMPWFTSSSINMMGIFLVYKGNSSTIKDMRYLSTKMNYTGMITTQTKFQLDPKKMKKAFIN